MSSESASFNEVKNLKQQAIPSPTLKPKTKILWRVIAETSLPAAHSFSPSNSPTRNRACLSNISTSRAAYMDVQKQYSFETVAVCVLPNHIHAIWTLPPDDADYSLLRRLIKTKFSAYSPYTKNLSAGKQRQHERGIWQRRFYGHTVRDETDLQRCATKRICSVARTTSIPILSNKKCRVLKQNPAKNNISLFKCDSYHSPTSNKACAT
ncbi:TPA: REP-associated tyrosine transposase [Neisseria meningitidis]